MTRNAWSLVAGTGLLAVMGVAATVIGDAVPGVNRLLVSVVLGVALVNLVGIPEWAERGVNLHGLWLETGIVLMGARFSMGSIAALGPTLLAVVIGAVVVSVCVIESLARNVFDLPRRFGSLLAAGASICGVSAVVATAGAIEADEEHITYAAATILLFDALTLATFPVLGQLLHFSPRAYGVWVGVTMFSTGPVAAAGLAHSAVAGRWATLTKITRNTFIGVAAVVYSLWYARASASNEKRSDLRHFWTHFPKFLVGFLLVAAVAINGLLTQGQVEILTRSSDLLFLLAFAGMGTDIQLDEMRSAGVVPVVVVLLDLLVIGALSFVAVTFTFG